MRQLFISVPRGRGDEVIEAARRCDGVNLACVSGTGGSGEPVDLAIVYLANARVGDLVDGLERIPELRIAMRPSEVLTMHPPAEEVADQVVDVTVLSPFEIFLGGLQSIGSWRGFLGYAVAAGAVVWLGLATNTLFLLVAAMLIAPFAGPAMVSALGTARGEWSLLWRSLARYAAALATTVVTAALLSLLFRQTSATDLMIATANVSTAAFLLPLVAGAAGALHLSQSDRSSLVAGAGTGMLVAASLAPPAGLLGMAVAARRWDLVQPALFLLALQLAGINLAGAAVFRLFGLRSEGPRYERGRRPVALAAAAATTLALAALLVWQFASASPELRRASLAQNARNAIERALDGDAEVSLVTADAHFTRARIAGQHTLLVGLVVQPSPETATIGAATRERVVRLARAAARREVPSATPLVDLTVLPGP